MKTSAGRAGSQDARGGGRFLGARGRRCADAAERRARPVPRAGSQGGPRASGGNLTLLNAGQQGRPSTSADPQACLQAGASVSRA